MKIPTLLLLATAAFLQAETLTTLDGKTYTGVSVTKTTPAAISISHSSGIAKIPFANLPEPLQRKYGYNPALAAEFAAKEIARHEEIKKQAEARQQQLEQAAAATQKKSIQKSEAGLTTLDLVTSDPITNRPFKLKCDIVLDSFYGIRLYEDAAPTHFVFRIRDPRLDELARGFMVREKGRALREAISANGGKVTAIITAIYLPERFYASNPWEFEILDFKILED